MVRRATFAWIGLAACVFAARATASGTEGASFLDIPAGGRPAALAGAYSALASDAYAPVWNPAGLAFVPGAQLAAMHADYDGIGGYEFASFVHPLGARGGLGASAQYFHADRTASLDLNGNELGSYSSYYGAYSLAYGFAFNEEFSIGAAAKLIDARLADVSARTGAGDVGALYRVNAKVSLAAVAANLGGKLKFLRQADELPRNYRLGVHYSPLAQLSLVQETVYDRTELLSGRFAAEWRPLDALAVRAGYRTDTARRLSALGGLTTGVGLKVWGQRFDYAWLPMGDLGQTQYFSVVLAFGSGL
ncbi:MAG: PorV/PorQ family protein [Elusimicrobiota bacterium]|nr:PorV/PorQ family protein [Elusimicrobiota bacterium]